MTPSSFSTPTSPTSPRAATRIRIKPHRQQGSQSTMPSPTSSSDGHAQRTRSMSLSSSKIVSAHSVPPGPNRMQATHAASKSVVIAKRRQSSIAYYTPSSPSPWTHRPQSSRTLSSGVDGPRDAEPVMANGKESSSHRSSLALGSRSPSTRDSVSSSDGMCPRERTPLTLVEKHADLLHFIAQKERKCLELRDQLAAHETELADFKRKWERIVNRGYDPLPNPPTTTGIGGVALDGLKEGVRIITAGFSDISGAIHELESTDNDASSQPKSLARSPRENHRGSGHPSTSSMSSIQESVPLHDVLERSEGKTIATAAYLSRAGSLDYQMHKRASRAFIVEEPPTPTSAFVPSSGRESPESTNLDVGMSLVLAPSPTLVPPPASTKPAQCSPSSPTSAGSMSSWMDSMSKRLSGLQNGSTFSKSQKRASSLLAGVSNSLVSALSPGPTPTTPAPLPSTTTATPRSTTSKLPPSPSRISRQSSQSTRSPPPIVPQSLHSENHVVATTTASWDWLNDDEEQTSRAGVDAIGVMMSDPKPPPKPVAPAVSSFDDDDWNW